jgi:processive 1,2-diacylglycerol beta-glucosyltransferase
VTPPGTKRILILTAAFGDGHNSAARNLASAMESLGQKAKVADPFLLAAPLTTRAICRTYRTITTRLPRLWLSIYRSTENRDFHKQYIPHKRTVELGLGRLLDEWRPDAVVSTYPLHPYFLAHLFESGHRRTPVFTVITDSIEINAAWRKAPTDFWLVTDPLTRESLLRAGLPAERVAETGFPVDPAFARLAPVPPDDPADPFRILFFPTASRSRVRRIGAALLDAGGPHARLTIVLGRNLRRLYRKARQLARAHPHRVTLRGWSRRVPEMMCSHHLTVGKAGGATVHEAIAAQCPMIVHHLVPGQEEGNLALLEQLGGGSLATTPERIATTVRDLLADNATAWRQSKRQLARLGRRSGAATAARFILDHSPPQIEPPGD